MTSDRDLLRSWWDSASTDGLWAAPWQQSIDDLSPAQAAWQPTDATGARRFSIWQHVLHMCFWREDALRRLTDPTKPSDDTVARLNFPEITDPSDAAWTATRARFARTHADIAARLREPASDISRLAFMVPHDCYHFGQINLLRALQGLQPIA